MKIKLMDAFGRFMIITFISGFAISAYAGNFKVAIVFALVGFICYAIDTSEDDK